MDNDMIYIAIPKYELTELFEFDINSLDMVKYSYGSKSEMELFKEQRGDKYKYFAIKNTKENQSILIPSNRVEIYSLYGKDNTSIEAALTLLERSDLTVLGSNCFEIALSHIRDNGKYFNPSILKPKYFQALVEIGYCAAYSSEFGKGCNYDIANKYISELVFDEVGLFTNYLINEL